MQYSIQEKIYEYIQNEYGNEKTVFLKELYDAFHQVKQSTIREMTRRLYMEGKVLRVKTGIYQLPNSSRILKKPTIRTSEAIESLYLKNIDGSILGYKSGINFANALGLTTQTASVETIYSNQVSSKKREVSINKLRFMIGTPRAKVTSINYKLLQIMDLFTSFDLYSEYEFKEALPKIKDYLSSTLMTEDVVEQIVSKYPLKAQVLFYKSGVQHELTQR
jgi:predicted transcriptional regulator of viral defense system